MPLPHRREAAAAKKGSPLRWRRAPKAAAAAAPGSRDGASSPDFGPMTKQRPGALFGARAPAAIGGGSGSGAGQQLVAMGPRGLTHESSGDVTAHVGKGAGVRMHWHVACLRSSRRFGSR